MKSKTTLHHFSGFFEASCSPNSPQAHYVAQADLILAAPASRVLGSQPQLWLLRIS